MTIFALEASRSPVAACVLQFNDDTPRVTIAILEAARSLAANCPALCEQALQNADCTLEDVDAIAVGLGPGSWTGLRVALSWAKTWAQTREIPILGVPSFDALAQSAWRASDGENAHRLMLVTAPCRGEEMYAKIYEAHTDYLLPAQEEWIGDAHGVIGALLTQAMARGIETPPLLISASDAGEADAVLQTRLIQELQDSRETAESVEIDIAHATVEIALAALIRLQNGEADDALSLQPLYLAPSAAERNLFQ